jgi:hypothetical protein
MYLHISQEFDTKMVVKFILKNNLYFLWNPAKPYILQIAPSNWSNLIKVLALLLLFNKKTL